MQLHLQAMVNLLRDEDVLRLVRLIMIGSIIEGLHGKRPKVTSVRLQDSPSKSLPASFYKKGESDMRSRVTWGFVPHPPSIIL